MGAKPGRRTEEVDTINSTDRKTNIRHGNLPATGAAIAPAVPEREAQIETGALRSAPVGACRFVSCAETDVATGEVLLPMGEKPQGFILYTPDGYMSAQLSASDRPDFPGGDMHRGTPEDYVAAATSYLAYSGPYHVDEARGIVEHKMAVSLFPNWTDQRQVRIAKLDGDQLVLATDGPNLFAGSLKTACISWRCTAPNW